MALTNAELGIISLFVSAVCYGLYLASLILCLRALLWTRDGNRLRSWREVHKPMFFSAIFIPVWSTTNLVLNLIRAIETTGHAVSKQFTDLGAPTEVLKFFCVDFVSLIVDFMMIYRVWVVYNRSWRMAAIPILLWFGVLVTLTLNIHYLQSTHTSLTAVNHLRPIITSFWSVSIALNILTTGLIIAKILTVDSNLAESSVGRLHTRTANRTLRNTIRVIVESGAMYTGLAIASCISYALGHVSVYIFTAMEVHVAGLAFNLIIIRVTANRQSGITSTNVASKQQTSIPLSFRRGQPASNLNTLQVSVDQTIHQDSDYDGYKQTETMQREKIQYA